MRRLEQVRSKRPFGVISEDGSGWVSLSTTPDPIKSENQNSDISPPRKRRPRNDTPSPERVQQPDTSADADLSPPRQTKPSRFSGGRTARHDTPSPENGAVSDKGTDLSPPRRQQRDKYASSPEAVGRSLHHKAAIDSDMSPPRRARRDSKSIDNLDNYDTTGRAPSVSDLSPPRKKRKESPTLPHHPKAGLYSGQDIKKEIDQAKKESWLR